MMDGGLIDGSMQEILSKNSRYRTPSLPEVVFLCFVIGRHIHIYISVYIFASRGGLVRVVAVSCTRWTRSCYQDTRRMVDAAIDEAVTSRGAR